MSPISGGDSGGVPPLPIPNREVKPACADGTAMQCGRVGNCLFSVSKKKREMKSSGREILRRTFFVVFFGWHYFSRISTVSGFI